MTRQHYQQDLADLRQDVMSMAERVLEQYEQSLAAYATGDPSIADAVVQGDHEINLDYLDLESDCIDLIALQQPVASDLRFIAASFKVLTDLERVGDLAVNLADYATWDADSVISSPEMRTLGEQAGSMVSAAVTAYEQNDADRAREIAAEDDALDRACRDASDRVVRGILADDPELLSDDEIERRLADISRTFLTIRDIERVGDHAVNICARTVYMVENNAELIY